MCVMATDPHEKLVNKHHLTARSSKRPHTTTTTQPYSVNSFMGMPKRSSFHLNTLTCSPFTVPEPEYLRSDVSYGTRNTSIANRY